MNERTLFIEALEITDPAERSAYLERACAGDTALRGQVEELLRAHTAPGPFMDHPTLTLAPGVEPITGGERPGAMIGPYRLIQQLGSGGMGVVFVAEQVEPLRRRVALKLIKPGMDSQQVIARFEAERQALARMDHAGIARVFDAGTTAAGRPYFVMELARGVSITEHCRQHGLGVAERLELFRAVCQAVQHAHHKGVIHRDLKPANVLVTAQDGAPAVKVIDFGVAKALGERLADNLADTSAVQVLGTPLYMPPEQAERGGLEVDTRSDVYALGVLLYELLTDTTPFDPERLRQIGYEELRRIIRDEEPPTPSARRATRNGAAMRRPNELDWIVMKAMAKERSRRYESASARAADVERYLRDEPVQACPPSARYRLRKLVRRHRGSVLASALLVLALVGGVIGTTWGMFRAFAAEVEAVEETRQKEAALQAARQSQREATDQLFLARLNHAQAQRTSRRMGQREDSLAAIRAAAEIRRDERLRDEAIAAMALTDFRRGPHWQVDPAEGNVAYDDGYRLSASVEGPAVAIRRLPDHQLLRRIDTGDCLGLLLSPDGRWLAVMNGERRVRLWRVADGQPAAHGQLGPCWSLAFSSDSGQLALSRPEGELVVVDPESGAETSRWRLPSKAHTLAFDPDGRRLAVGHASASATGVYDVATGQLLAGLPVGNVREQVVAWHPHGERLAVSGSDARIQVWDVPGKRRVVLLEGHAQQVGVLTFQPGGDLLVSNSWENVARVWHAGTGQLIMKLPFAVQPRFSSDGRWLGVARHGADAQLMEVVPCPEYRTLTAVAQGQDFPGFGLGDISSDGRLLAVLTADTHLWSLESGRERATLAAAQRVAFRRGAAGLELLLGGAAGLQGWPLRLEGDTLHVGKPRLLSPFAYAEFALSQDGATLFASGGNGAVYVIDAETAAVRRLIAVQPRIDRIILSRDGRWMATTGWHADRVRVCDVQTGRRVHEWPGNMTEVFFTPDSQALITSGRDEYAFWAVDSWELLRRDRRDVTHYSGYVAFAPDGRLMAMEMALGVLELRDVQSGRTVARLEDPQGERANWMSFTPDGTRLVVAGLHADGLRVWDLRAIRAHLATMGLDWEWPPFDAAR
jgi:serine/threonine protein kinase/WD40 repeat protein